MDQFFDGLFEGNPGQVTSRDEWPWPLERIATAANEAEVKIEKVQVYCIANGISIEYVWRMKSTDALLELLIQELGLTIHDPPPHEKFRSQSDLPGWWSPQEHVDSHYYAGNLGGEGEQFIVLHDEADHTIFVYFYDNW